MLTFHTVNITITLLHQAFTQQ